MTTLFNEKKPNSHKLLEFGFTEKNGNYMYSTSIMDNKFTLIVTLKNNEVDTKVIDSLTQEEYTLHLVPQSSGLFVGTVKNEYENILNEIVKKCFETDIFKSDYTKKVMEYIKIKYENEAEFLWKKSNNAVFRRKDTKKWYGALLILSSRKLGFDSDKVIEIIDLRAKPEHVQSLVDDKKYLRGYHMNKKHWITICLDGSVPIDDILPRIDESYNLAVK